MTFPVQHALLLSVALFTIGVVGVFLRRNIITIFMCIELMLNAVNLAFVAYSRALGALDGQILVFFVMIRMKKCSQELGQLSS